MEFLKKLINAESPSGFEQNAKKVWVDAIDKNCDEVRLDVHGNSTGVYNQGGNKKVMFSAHIDEVGYIVKHIDDDGYIYVTAIGGIDRHLMPGQMVNILTEHGIIIGVVGRKPVHCLDEDNEEEDTVAKMHELWIDIGVNDFGQTVGAVRIGDPIVPSNTFAWLMESRITGRGLDDKAGVWVMAKLIEALKKNEMSGETFPAIYCSATVQEEIGCRGAITSTYNINPEVAIAIDATFATDHPYMDKEAWGDIEVGGGPVICRGANINTMVFDELVASAEAINIPYQIEAEPGKTGTDAEVMQVSRNGVATGLVSIPLRYMHSPVEVVDVNDMKNTVKLLTKFCSRMSRNISFVPKWEGDTNAF